MSILLFVLSFMVQPTDPWLATPSFPARWMGDARPKSAPQRIVTVAPSITEILFALGQGSHVVGVTRFDDFPPEADLLPEIGGFLDPSVEKILELKADLVIAAPNASNRVPLAKLVSLGTPVLVVPGNGFADLFHSIDAIGTAVRAEPEARALGDRLRAEVRALIAVPRPKTRVVVVYDRNPLIVGGPGSFADTLVRLLGAENVVKVQSEYPTYSREQLLVDAPEVLIDASLTHWTKTGTSSPALAPMDGANAEFWKTFASLPAVRDHRVYGITGSELLRPGPRLTAGMRRLAEVLERK